MLVPYALIPCALLACADASAATATPGCDSLDPGRKLEFQGSPRREAAELGSAAANRIDAQLSRGACRSAANAGVDALLAAGPDDPVANYLDARRDLLDARREVAERKLQAVLVRRPGFAPAQILLAQALVEREQRTQARALLDASDAAAPGDLRAAFLRLRLEALDTPKGPGVGQISQALRNPALTPELREMAGETLLYARALEFGEKEAALREMQRFESQTPGWNKRLKLGRFLAEDAAKPAPAREVLAQVLAEAAPATAKDDARVLVAETWLLDAAAIDPQPSARNAAQVAQARAAVQGNMLPVAKRIRQWHNLAQLEPFVSGTADPDVRDARGQTALCRATQALDAAAVAAALDAGAAVDGECAGASGLAYVVRAGPGDFARKRAVAELLLAHGADPDPKLYPGATYTARSFCADNFPDCQRDLLPLLDAAVARRTGAPTTPR
jgi:hypothetical protein